MRGFSVVPLILLAALSPACSGDSDESGVSAEQTQALCDALTTWREESLANLGGGDPLDPDEYNAEVAEFYLRLREFVPGPIQEDIELMAGSVGEDLRDATDDVQDAAVRVGTYFHEQCGDQLAPE